MFPGLPIFGKHGQATVSPGLPTFGKFDMGDALFFPLRKARFLKAWSCRQN